MDFCSHSIAFGEVNYRLYIDLMCKICYNSLYIAFVFSPSITIKEKVRQSLYVKDFDRLSNHNSDGEYQNIPFILSIFARFKSTDE